ncbi:Root cap [Sesbania bispinosa]|nr:Root cap [Sesbania bispinosa]
MLMATPDLAATQSAIPQQHMLVAKPLPSVKDTEKRKVMGISSSNCLIFVLLLFAFSEMQTIAGVDTLSCNFLSSPCFGKKVKCPAQCPLKSPSDPNAKVCFLDCTSPVCKTHCRQRKPNCNGRGSACLDPRFVGPDGTVFYFHGKRNEHFSLVSDVNLQVNARFIGLRPEGRTRDYTWIQALGILFDSHKLTVEATPAATWDDGIDHLKFSYNGEELVIPEGYLSTWESPENQLRVERTSTKNSVTVSLPEIAEISVNVVPVTQEDSRIHNYQIPDDDCFAHLEVQFKFYHLSSKVDGVLGRTYQPDFQNPAKLGVAMSVLGGEDSYRTTSLLSADCGVCLFATGEGSDKKNSVMEYGMLDCTGVDNSGNGIVCRR